MHKLLILHSMYKQITVNIRVFNLIKINYLPKGVVIYVVIKFN